MIRPCDIIAGTPISAAGGDATVGANSGLTSTKSQTNSTNQTPIRSNSVPGVVKIGEKDGTGRDDWREGGLHAGTVPSQR